VLLAGLAAGVVINSLAYLFAIEYILDGPNFAKPWAEVIPELKQPFLTPTNFIAVQQVWGFLIGIVTIWLYARRGATQRSTFPWVPTLIAWASTSAVSCGVLFVERIPLSLVALIAGLFEVAMGALLGSWIYREAEAALEQATAGRIE